jgi:hypothetical protein
MRARAALLVAGILAATVRANDDEVFVGDEPSVAPATIVAVQSPPPLTAEEIALFRRWAANQQDKEEAGADDSQKEKEPAAENQQAAAGKQEGQQQNGNGNGQRRPRFDQAVVEAGRAAFDSGCTSCHDADRSTSKRKSLAGWLATVRRMAAKEGADIPPADFQPIATYLASLGAPADGSAGDGTGGDGAAAEGESGVTVFGTVSLNYRNGANFELENPGFFPEVWLGAEWQGSGPVSLRVNTCVTCHTENPAVSSRIELAEGLLRLDVDKLVCCSDDADLQASVQAGRFIVPFGAFAAQSHPAAFRTATRPLMYNMGQKVYRDELGAPILPMPFSDEGVLAGVNTTLLEEITVDGDFYAINGLQGSTAIDLPALWQSRDYVDNNEEPSIGGRVTAGTKMLKFGASIMSGRYNEDGPNAIVPEALTCKLYGGDVTFRWNEKVRIQYEYARRTSETFDFNTLATVDEDLKGQIIEGEFQLYDCPKITGVVRYDDQRRDEGPPTAIFPTGEYTVTRFTYGVNIWLGSSILMLNHERWHAPEPLEDQDVFAMRWVATF